MPEMSTSILHLVFLGYALWYANGFTLDNVRSYDNRNHRKGDVLQSVYKSLEVCKVPADCSSCDKSCPERLFGAEGEYKREIKSCQGGMENLRQSLKNLGDRTLLEECSFDTCYGTRKKEACGIPIDASKSEDKQLREMQALVSAMRKEKSELDRRFEAKRSAHEASPFYRYHSELTRAFEAINKHREDALKIRSDNHELREFLSSYNFRRRKQEVTRIRLENQNLKRHFSFWQRQKKTLSLAMRTSPRALKDARNQLHESMLQYEADSELIAVLRNASLTKEGQVKLVKELKEDMQIQLDAARTINAQVKAEAVFIQKARTEIYNLLVDVLYRTRSGIVTVGCGGAELGKAVGKALMTP